jgi:hypothetical protein
MKRTLIILTLALTSSIANISTPSITTNSKHMDTGKKPEITIKKNCTSRNVRVSREIRKNRNVKIEKIEKTEVEPSLRRSRGSREIRENRFIVQKTRKSRDIRHVLIQDKLYFVNLK